MNWHRAAIGLLACSLGCVGALLAGDDSQIGREVAVPVHLQDGEEYQRPIRSLIEFGRKLFTARWTSEEGAGRPLTREPACPLLIPRGQRRSTSTR